MSFSTEPKPQAPQSNTQNTPQTPRDRAIAKLTTPPVQDPTKVAPEELQAVKPSSAQSEQGQNSPNEGSTRAPESKSVVTEDKALSPQYAALARKERALRAQVQQFKAEQIAFKQSQEQAKALEAKVQAATALEERLAKDPLGVLAEKGITYEQLTTLLLNGQAAAQTPQDVMISKLEAKIAALEDANKQVNTSIEARETQAYNQAVAQIRSETKVLVSNDPEFETIKATNSVNDVVELIELTFKKDGVLLTVEEAARAVEDHLVEEAMKITKINKIQRKLAPPVQTQPSKSSPQSENPPQKQPQQSSMTTLTNSVGTAKPLTARQRALLAFEGKLKQ